MPSTLIQVNKTGGSYRVLAALSPVTWNRISLWTGAIDTVFDDTYVPDPNEQDQEKLASLQYRFGNMRGITSDRTSKTDTYAASTNMVHGLAGEFLVNISSSDWSGSTVTINGINYYTCTKNCTMVFNDHPIMFLALNTLPTDAQQEAYNKLEMIADSTNNVLTFYSEDNTVALPIGIKGVI